MYDGSTGDATYDGLSYIDGDTHGDRLDKRLHNRHRQVERNGLGGLRCRRSRRRIHGSEIQVWPWFVPNDPVSSSDYYRVTITDSGTSHTAYYDTCGYSAYERGSSMMDTYQWYRVWNRHNGRYLRCVHANQR